MAIEAWFLPALLSLIVWGATGILSKLTVQRLVPIDIIIYNAVFFFGCAVVIQFFYAPAPLVLTGVIFAVVTGMIGSFGQLCHLQALRTGSVTLVVMVSSLYPILSTILAVVYLHEPLSVKQCLGILLGIGSIILLVKSDGK